MSRVCNRDIQIYEEDLNNRKGYLYAVRSFQQLLGYMVTYWLYITASLSMSIVLW
jgi:hypothetical protein